MEKLNEIKRGQEGFGILIENEGYINPKDKLNSVISESIESSIAGGDDFHCPYPLVYNAVLQRYGVENANGRIYPESVLKREVDKYQELVKERRALGECYRPETMILTETGWKQLSEVVEGENILTLNPESNEIEIKPIKKVVRYHHDGKMVRLSGKSINDLVTPEHGFPMFGRKNKFDGFVTADEILNESGRKYAGKYIPKTGAWIGKDDKFFVIPKIDDSELACNIKHTLREKYSNDLVIPMDVFAKFMGIYLSEGSHSKKFYRVNIHQKKLEVCEEIEKMLDELGLPYTINIDKSSSCRTFVISDIRLWRYVHQFGLCYDKYVPYELKQQSKETLRIFYDWFVLGDGRVRGYGKYKNTDNVFSTSKRLALDLNEIQLKIGYCGSFHVDERNYDRLIEGRTIKAENSNPVYFSYRTLIKGTYLDKRFIKVTEEDYNGDVMCVEVDNHIWFVMDNGYCHWTKNCNHPNDVVIDLSRVAINVTEMHWDGNTLVGKIEVITSPGFRRHGTICCEGDQVANLLLSGYKIGLSSRGVGTVTTKYGQTIVGDDYSLAGFDVVSDPSTHNAWIVSDGSEGIPTAYLESKEKGDKPVIFEELSRFDSWLND